MTPATMLRIGAILGGLAVAFGAFGAHGLRELLTERGHVETFETAARYQMYHALALLLCAALAHHGYRLAPAAWSFLLGTVMFCGSLYVLALVGPPVLGAVTPAGGVLLLIGWGALLRVRTSGNPQTRPVDLA